MEEERKNVNFQLEIITESLRELQQEKRRLEIFLETERARRIDTEAKLNLVNARFMNVQERHSKISATRDIAKQRMTESKEVVNKLQNLHLEKQKKIADTKERINLEKKRKEEMGTEFALQLENLAKKFFSAREEFDEKRMQDEQEELEKKIIDTENSALENKRLVDKLTDQFSKCKVEEDERKESTEEWPSLEEVELVLNIIKEEETLANDQHKKNVEELRLANERLESLKMTLKNLEIDEQAMD